MTAKNHCTPPGSNDNWCKGGALVHHQTYSSQNWQKRSKWKDLCSGMPKRDSCSRNQLFHLEISSFNTWLLRILARLFCTNSGFTAWWEQLTHCGSQCKKTRPEYPPWDMSVLGLMNDNAANLHLATQTWDTQPQAAVEHQLCLDFHGNRGYELTRPGPTERTCFNVVIIKQEKHFDLT